MSALLTIHGLTARYGQINALQNVSLEVGESEAVALVGANGAGKSTLMKCVMGMLGPATGVIEFRGKSLAGVSVASRARQGIGYSPEGRRIFPGMTVNDNLEVASRTSGKITAETLRQVYQMFPVLEERKNSLGWQLSGGQQQMLAIGRALMTRPRLLLLDEPSLGLSPLLTLEVIERVRSIVAGGTAVLLAEQNVAKALKVTSRAYVLQVGKVIQSATSSALHDDPRVRAAFLGG